MAAHCHARRLTQGKFRAIRLPKTCPTHGTDPRNPRFAARPKGVAAQRRVWGSQEGAREPYGALAPFCLRRQTAAFSPVNTGTPGRRRRPLPTPSEGVNLASSGAPPTRRKGLPPADDKVFKGLQSLLQRLFLKSLAFHPAVRYNKTTRRGKAFTSRISLTALSLRKGAKAIRTAGSNAEHGNFVALLNFYKLAD